MPFVQEGDLFWPFPTKGMTYVLRGETETPTEAFCAIPTDDGRCSLYIPGYGLAGEFRAFTTACDAESSVMFSVGRDADLCIETVWVPMSVDTKGCIKSPSPEGNPPPATVAGGTEVTN